MFRPMLRKQQQLPEEECLRLLTEETRGVLSLLGDEGWPYGIPLNHYYCPEDGKLYFHSGLQGHKVDALRAYPKASYCVFDRGVRPEGDWAFRVKSVIVFGRIEIVEDREQLGRIARALSHKFTDDEAYIEREILLSGPRTLLFALVPEHMTGKQVTES